MSKVTIHHTIVAQPDTTRHGASEPTIEQWGPDGAAEYLRGRYPRMGPPPKRTSMAGPDQSLGEMKREAARRAR